MYDKTRITFFIHLYFILSLVYSFYSFACLSLAIVGYRIINGILNLFLFQPETKLLENIIAINLYNKYGEELYYYNVEPLL